MHGRAPTGEIQEPRQLPRFGPSQPDLDILRDWIDGEQGQKTPAPTPGKTETPQRTAPESAPKPQPQPQTGTPKRHPKQKDDCSNERYDELRDKITACKRMSFSCSDAAERAALGITTRKAFEKPGAPRWPREEILRRLAQAEECAKARDDFQRECFEPSPGDPDWENHEKQRLDWKIAEQLCRDKARARGYLP